MNNSHTPTENPNWERKTLEKIALAGIKEQRRGRRWKIFFTLLFFVYLTVIAVGLFHKSTRSPKYDIMGNSVDKTVHGHIAFIRLQGAIADSEEANARRLSFQLRRAAAKDEVKGILIEANSPGGSPVQSSLVYQTLQTIRAKYGKPVMTAVTDVCASGCYYIVSASDEIYADKSSIIGSIGVISQSFGYAEAAKKLGIEPRTYTAGENKDFLNPARQPTPEEIAFLQRLLNNLHQNFIDAVKAGRGEKLKEESELFSGLFWTGDKAKDLGLIDGIATPEAVAKKIGNYPVYDYSRQSVVEKVLKRFGAEAEEVVSGSLNKVLNPETGIDFK